MKRRYPISREHQVQRIKLFRPLLATTAKAEDRQHAQYFFVRELMETLPAFRRVPVPSRPPGVPVSPSGLTSLIQRARSMSGSPQDREAALEWCHWRAKVTRIEQENVSRLTTLLRAYDSLHGISAIAPSDRRLKAMLDELGGFILGQYKMTARPGLARAIDKSALYGQVKEVQMLPRWMRDPENVREQGPTDDDDVTFY